MSKLPKTVPLFIRALDAAGGTQTNVANAMGISRRTISRYVASGSPMLMPWHLEALARLVARSDLELAAELAAAAGTTLEKLGLVAPRPAPPAPAPSAPPLGPAQVDSIVCAAAEQLAVPPQQVRPSVAAAFARAHELGYSIAQVTQALAKTTEAAHPTPSAS